MSIKNNKVDNNSKVAKKPVITRILEKRITPVIDNLLYTTFYWYCDNTGNKDNISYDEYCGIIRDLLKANQKEV